MPIAANPEVNQDSDAGAGPSATAPVDSVPQSLVASRWPEPSAVVSVDKSCTGTIAEKAIASTVEVDSQACSYTLAGSGFVVADGYVVTNAHVVAGAHAIRVLPQSGGYTATAVFFYRELDVALLRVPGLTAPALRFADASPARGTIGAALGHPGGGPLAIVAAAVADDYDATGRDLYGEQNVTRAIVELRATIERGDSGGPFVLEDGSVGGVVFAQSRTDTNVGYALAPSAVSSAIAGSLAAHATQAVDTGECIR